MIRKIRKKFIVAAIISVFLVLFLLIGSINLLNYRNLISDARLHYHRIEWCIRDAPLRQIPVLSEKTDSL